MLNYDKFIFLPPIIDGLRVRFKRLIDGDLSKMAKTILDNLQINQAEINIKRNDIYEYNAFVLSFGFNIKVVADYVELDFKGAFFSFSGKDINELYRKCWAIIRLSQSILRVPPLIHQIDIAVDILNFNLIDYFENDFLKNKTLFPKKTIATAMKDGENNFNGTIIYKFPNSSAELVLYMKGREIEVYQNKISKGRGGLKSKLEKYEELGYMNVPQNELTRAELRIKRRAIKENYQTLIFQEKDLSKTLKEILSHFYQNRRIFFNPSGELPKEWRLKEKSKHFEEHRLFKKIFLREGVFSPLSIETPSGHLLQSKALRSHKDFDQALIDLIYQYSIDDDYLSEQKLTEITKQVLLKIDLVKDELESRRKRIHSSWLYLEKLSTQPDENEIKTLQEMLSK